MTLAVAATLFVVAFAAGELNAVAGGSTLLTFPARVAAGVQPIVANATSLVVRWRGYVDGIVDWSVALVMLSCVLTLVFSWKVYG